MDRVARVIVNLFIDKVYDYSIPEEMASAVRVGRRVEVPFGKSTRRGYVVALAAESVYPSLKPILKLYDQTPAIPPSLLALGEWIADYYCCSREQATRALLPGPVRSGKISRKTIAMYSVADPKTARTHIIKNKIRQPASCRILTALLQRGEMTGEELRRWADASQATVKKLLDGDLLKRENRETYRDPFEEVTIIPSAPKTLTDEQKVAVDAIEEMASGSDARHVLLLHGVTGSGKTEVYLQAIDRVRGEGKEAIVLVPEISLTPQTVERFRARFGDDVSVLHSGLGDGERYDEWMKIHNRETRVVVGARSALFAPFRNLGLIIVDEEHENSYKQSEAPRYHARDVAVMRGHRENAVVILGSATPSLESYHNAACGKYRLATLMKRIDDASMPRMRVVDLKAETARTGERQFLSKVLVEDIRIRLEKGEQTILFLNRRGYARQLICLHCGYQAECADCSISYTYHRSTESLRCHLCGAVEAAPTRCPDCGARDIRYSKMGTERVESIVKSLFKNAKVARMDSDTMTRKSAYEETLSEFKRNNINILLGTQMIAKGLHFPNVTLVGVLLADLSLSIPDFRSVERTFQLLTQVAGRAGRGDVEGEVLIQTLCPFNTAIQHAVAHDYQGFYEDEMEIRSQLRYPPVSHLIAVHVQGPDPAVAADVADRFHESVKPALDPTVTVSEPEPAPVEKIKGNYRFMMMYRGKALARVRRLIRHQLLHGKRPRNVRVHVDVDALNLM